MNNNETISFNDVPKVVGEILNKVEKLEKAQNQPQQEKREEFLTRKEVMEKLKISSFTTVIRLEKEGTLKPIRVGKRYLYKLSDLEKLR